MWGRLSPKGICLFVSCLLIPFNPVVCFPVEQPDFDRLGAVLFPPQRPADVKQPFPTAVDHVEPRLLGVPLVRLDDARLSPGHSFQDQAQLFPSRSYHFHIKPIKPQEQVAYNISQSPDSLGRDSKVKQRFSSMFSFNADAYFPPIPDLPPPPRSLRRAQRKRIRSNPPNAPVQVSAHTPKIPKFPKLPKWMESIVENSQQFPHAHAKDTAKKHVM